MISPLSLIMVLVVAAGQHCGAVSKPVNTYAAITEVTRVQNFARNSLLLWLGGSIDVGEAPGGAVVGGPAIALSQVLRGSVHRPDGHRTLAGHGRRGGARNVGGDAGGSGSFDSAQINATR